MRSTFSKSNVYFIFGTSLNLNSPPQIFLGVRVRMPKPRVNIPAKDITFKYVHSRLIHIQELIRWQSIVFRRENHNSLDFEINDLIKNVKLKSDFTCSAATPEYDKSNEVKAKTKKEWLGHDPIYS